MLIIRIILMVVKIIAVCFVGWNFFKFMRIRNAENEDSWEENAPKIQLLTKRMSIGMTAFVAVLFAELFLLIVDFVLKLL